MDEPKNIELLTLLLLLKEYQKYDKNAYTKENIRNSLTKLEDNRDDYCVVMFNTNEVIPQSINFSIHTIIVRNPYVDLGTCYLIKVDKITAEIWYNYFVGESEDERNDRRIREID